MTQAERVASSGPGLPRKFYLAGWLVEKDACAWQYAAAKSVRRGTRCPTLRPKVSLPIQPPAEASIGGAKKAPRPPASDAAVGECRSRIKSCPARTCIND